MIQVILHVVTSVDSFMAAWMKEEENVSKKTAEEERGRTGGQGL